MTSADPTHFPWNASDGKARTGQAVHTSVPKARRDSIDFDEIARQARKSSRSGLRKADEELRGRIRAPPIPDLRFEQSFLLSIKPFVSARKQKPLTESYKDQVKEQIALVDVPDKDIYSGDISVQWRSVFWIIFRDQLLSPLIQGAAWSLAGLLLSTTFSKFRSGPR